MPNFTVTLKDGSSYTVTAPNEGLAAQAVRAKLSQPKPEPGSGGVLGYGVNSLLRSFTDIPGDLAEAFSEDPANSGAKQFSDTVGSGIDSLTGVDRTKEMTTGEQIGQIGGSLASFLIPGLAAGKVAKGLGAGAKAIRGASLAGAAPVAIPGGLGQQNDMVRDAEARGIVMTDSQKNMARLSGATIGALDLLPLGRFLGPIGDLLAKVPLTKAGTATRMVEGSIRRALGSATEEGAQEAFAQLAQNLTAAGIYDPELDVTEGLMSNAIAGGGAGAAMSAIIDLITKGKSARKAGRERDLSRVIGQEAAEGVNENIRADSAFGFQQLQNGKATGPIRIMKGGEGAFDTFDLVDSKDRVYARLQSIDAAINAGAAYEQSSGGKAKFVTPTREVIKQMGAKATANAVAKAKAAAATPTPVTAPTTEAPTLAPTPKVGDTVPDGTPVKPATVARGQTATGVNGQPIPTPPSSPSEGSPAAEAGLSALPEAAPATEPETAAFSEPETAEASPSFEERDDRGAMFSKSPVVAPDATTAPTSLLEKPINRATLQPGQKIITEELKSSVNAVLGSMTPQTRSDLATSVNKVVSGMGLPDVRVKLVDFIRDQDVKTGQVGYARGVAPTLEADGSQVVQVAIGIYDPALTPEQLTEKVVEILNHELVHAFVNLGVIKPGEIQTLFKSTDKIRYPGTKFTYLDRAYRTYAPLKEYADANGNPDVEKITEEAVAEMFRDAVAGRLKLNPEANGILQRIMNFLRRLFRSFNGTEVDRIFRDMQSGKIGGRERGAAPSVSGSAEMAGEPVKFSVAPSYKPKKTITAYKLFRVKRGDPGLYPLFVNANQPVPVGEWVEAEEGERKGKGVKSRIGELAYRPGWHSGDMAIATHIGGKSAGNTSSAPDTREPDQVWAEVEVPNDVDWQSIANARAERTKDGRMNLRTAQITDQIPLGGNYRYKTNSNMTGNWVISGHIKVLRVLSDAEVDAINAKNGVKDLPRVKPRLDTGSKFSVAPDVNSEEFRRWFKSSQARDANGKPQVFYNGRPRPLREGQFNRGASGALPGQEGPYYFSPVSWFASQYAERDMSKGSDRKDAEAGTMYPVFLSAQNPWDYNNPRNVDDVVEYIANGLETGKIDPSELKLARAGVPSIASLKRIGIFLEDGDWDAVEVPAVQKAIRDLGFDGFFLVEEDVRNLAVYKPEQVKSIFNQFEPGTAESRKLSIAPQVSDNTKNRSGRVFSLFPYLRTKAPKYYENNRRIAAETTPRNAGEQIAELDGLLSRHPNTLQSEAAFADYLADLFGKKANENTGVPLIPYNAVKLAADPSIIASQLATLTPGQMAQANEGLREALRLKKAYQSGKAKLEHTGKLLLWGILSRGVSPFVQESLFLDAVMGRGNIGGVDKFVSDAAKGEFDLNEYKEWLANVIPEGATGAGATHNLGAFGRTTLTKLQKKLPNGQTLFERLHELFSDYSMSGKEIRREFHRINSGIGVNNKVISFMLLISGRDDVMVLDRVQMRNQFDDGRFNGYNLYDGVKAKAIKEDGKEGAAKALSGTSIDNLGKGVFGLAYYEAMERDLMDAVRQAYASVGRPNDASMGRYHWESWVASSAQEVDHGTISGIINDALGTVSPYGAVKTTEGKYDTFMSGARYGYTISGEPYIALTDGSGNYYAFSPTDAKAIVKGYKVARNKIIRVKNYKVSDSKAGAWFNGPGIDKDALGRYLRSELERRRNPEQSVLQSGEGDAYVYRPRVGRTGIRRVSEGKSAQEIADKYMKPPASAELQTAEGIAEAVQKSSEATQAEADMANEAVLEAVRKLSVAPVAAPMPTYLRQQNDNGLFNNQQTPATVGEKLMSYFSGARTSAGRQNVSDTFRFNFVDRRNQIAKVENDLIRAGGMNTAAEFSAVAAANMFDRASHYNVASMENGAGRIKEHPNGGKDSRYLQIEESVNAPSPKKVLEILLKGGPGGTSLLEHFRTVGVAQMAEARQAQGKVIPSQIDQRYIQEAKQLLVQYPELQKAYDIFQQFNKQMIQNAADAGVISQAAADDWTKDMNYTSMYHQYSYEEQATTPGTSGGLGSKIVIKQYKGSTSGQLMGDPILAMMHNVSFWNTAILKNLAAQKAYKLGKQVGIVDDLAPTQDIDPSKHAGVAFANFDGVTKRFAVSDELFYGGLQMAENPDIGMMLELIGLPTQIIREAVTRDPGFMIANLLRDSLSSWLVAGSSASPLGTFLGLKSALQNSSSLKVLKSFGITGSYDEASKSPAKYVRDLQRNLMDAEPGTNGAIKIARMGWDTLGRYSEASDAATRIAVYEAAKAEGDTDFTASMKALNIMNFSRTGNSIALKAFTQVIPFLNARIQGLDVTYQGVKAATNYARGADQTGFERERGAKVLMRAMMLATASVILSMINEDDENYKELPQYMKDGNFIIPVGGGKFLQAPKPFEAGLFFSTIPQALYDYSAGNRSARSVADLFWGSIASTLGINPIPQFMLPIVENMTNTDLYTGMPLISAGMEKLDPSLQYNASTTLVAKGLSSLLKYPFGYNTESGQFENVSPIQIDNIISGYGGPIGSYISMAMGAVMNVAGNDNTGLPTAFSNYPIIRRFFVDAADRSPASSTEAYELYQLVDRVNRTMSRLKKSGDFEGLKEYRDENINILRFGKQVQRMTENLGSIRGQIRRLEQDTKLSGAEKLAKMRELRAREVVLTRKVKEISSELGR